MWKNPFSSLGQIPFKSLIEIRSFILQKKVFWQKMKNGIISKQATWSLIARLIVMSSWLARIGPGITTHERRIRTNLKFQCREKRTRPWLETPKTDFKLQCREMSKESQPCEAAVASLPHHLHPCVPMEKSEVQARYTNHFQVEIKHQ